jgi:hypothetical protein
MVEVMAKDLEDIRALFTAEGEAAMVKAAAEENALAMQERIARSITARELSVLFVVHDDEFANKLHELVSVLTRYLGSSGYDKDVWLSTRGMTLGDAIDVVMRHKTARQILNDRAKARGEVRTVDNETSGVFDAEEEMAAEELGGPEFGPWLKRGTATLDVETGWEEGDTIHYTGIARCTRKVAKSTTKSGRDFSGVEWVVKYPDSSQGLVFVDWNNEKMEGNRFPNKSWVVRITGTLVRRRPAAFNGINVWEINKVRKFVLREAGPNEEASLTRSRRERSHR